MGEIWNVRVEGLGQGEGRENVGKGIAVVRQRAHAGSRGHSFDLAEENRDRVGDVVVGAIGVEPQNAVFADHPAVVVEALDADVVEASSGSLRMRAEETDWWDLPDT